MVRLSSALAKIEDAVKLRHLGLGFLWAWIYCFFAMSSVYSEGFAVEGSADLFWLVSEATVTVSLFAFGIGLRRRDLSRCRPLVVAGALLVAFGTFALPFVDSLAVGLAYGVATGVGSAILFVFWGDALARIGVERMEVALPASEAITIVCAIVVPAIEGVPGALVAALLPIASAACLVATYDGLAKEREEGEAGQGTSEGAGVDVGDAASTSMEGASPVPAGGRPAAHPGASSAETRTFVHAPTMVRLLILVFLAYFVVGCLLCVGLFQDMMRDAETYQAASLVGPVVGLAITLWFIFFSPRVDVAGMLKWLFPVMCVAVAVLPLGTSAAGAVVIAVVRGSSVVMQVIATLYFVGLACRGLTDGCLAMGVSRGIEQLGVLAGYLAGLGFAKQVASGGMELWMVAIVLMLVLSLASAFVPTGSASIPSVAEEAEGEVSVPAAAAAGATAGAQTGDSAYEDAGAVGDEPSLSAPPAGRAPADEEESRRHATVLRLSEEHGLSARETEILEYLSKGRSQPYIRDELVLSKNTVATHVKHIYQKLDVHSRQELLDLFEADGQGEDGARRGA